MASFKIEDDVLVQLARLGLTGRAQDVQAYLRQSIRKIGKADADLAKRLSDLLAIAPSPNAPLREMGGGMVPVDADSRPAEARISRSDRRRSDPAGSVAAQAATGSCGARKPFCAGATGITADALAPLRRPSRSRKDAFRTLAGKLPRPPSRDPRSCDRYEQLPGQDRIQHTLSFGIRQKCRVYSLAR